MTWRKVNPTTWIHDTKPYIYENGILYNTETNEQVLDIFDLTDNPPFSYVPPTPDPLTVNTLTVNQNLYFADGAVLLPSFSLNSEKTSGLYKLSSNNIGLAINGVYSGRLNSYGFISGTPGTDYRNLLKRSMGDLRRIASPTNDSNTTSSTLNSSGIGISYTPLNLNSLIKLTFIISHRTIWNGSSTAYETSYIAPYVDTSSVPNLGSAIPGSSSAIYTGLLQCGVGHQNGGYFINVSNTTLEFYYQPGTISPRYYYLAFKLDSSNGSFTLNSGSTSLSKYIIEEFL